MFKRWTAENEEPHRTAGMNIGRPLVTELYVPMKSYFAKHTEDTRQKMIASGAFGGKPLFVKSDPIRSGGFVH